MMSVQGVLSSIPIRDRAVCQVMYHLLVRMSYLYKRCEFFYNEFSFASGNRSEIYINCNKNVVLMG